MSAPGTIVDLIDFGDDDRAAILAPGREPLSFAALRALVRDTVASLNRLAIGRGDRVAIVLAQRA